MAKKRSLHSILIPQLRRISKFYPEIQEARKRAKVKVDDGVFKNGNPKFKTMFKCEKCGAIVDKVEIDHIQPVGGFIDHGSWDNYIKALFCDANNLQAICSSCHQSKTEGEQKARQEKRKLKKALDKQLKS